MSDLSPGLVAALIMLLGLLNLAVLAFIAWKFKREVDARLSRCSILQNGYFLGSGGWDLMEDIQDLGLVAYILMFPGSLLKRGVIDGEQVAAFPKKLKKLIVVPVCVNIAFILAMFLFYLWMHFLEL